MRTATAVTLALALGMVWCLVGAAAAQPVGEKATKKEEPQKATSGVAVVEVFTSEGCDSCPPAEDLAAKISREAKEQGKNVFVLAMHVDYWDYLGWKDPFAKHGFSTRQKSYSATLGAASGGGSGGVYTPQMVVNGAAGFDGSDAAKGKAAIDKALADSTRLRISAQVAPRKAGEPVKVRARMDGDSRWTVLSAAMVEDGLSVEVKAGENKGKTLRHDRVVRAFGQQTVKDGAAEVELKLPGGVKEQKCRVVVFAQDEKTMRVLGAAEIGLEAVATQSPAK